MIKLRNIFRLLVSFALVMASVSCVHEWPEPTDTDLILNLEFDTDLPQGPEMNLDTKSDDQAYDVRYIVEAYPEIRRGEYDESTPAGRFVFTKDDINNIDNTVRISILEGKYLFRVWTDYVDAGSKEDKFYKTDKFTAIKLFGNDEKVAHVGNCDYRDAFAGYKEIDVIRYGSSMPPVSETIKMSRPLSKIVFYTNDLDRWKTKMLVTMYEQALKEAKPGETVPVPTHVNLDDYTVKIMYPIYMPNTFNLSDDHTAWSATNVSFDSKMVQIDENMAFMGFDYVFANAVKPTVDMAVALYDKNGKQLARSGNFNVKLERGKVTTVTGSFLMKKSDGGIAINPDFDGEFNIIL
jgi:hypothetical protein